jgi:hypothetical protein
MVNPDFEGAPSCRGAVVCFHVENPDDAKKHVGGTFENFFLHT